MQRGHLACSPAGRWHSKPPHSIPIPLPPYTHTNGAAMCMMSSGKPQDLQTRSCSLVARRRPPASCLALCTAAHGSPTPWHIAGPAVAATVCGWAQIRHRPLCVGPQCPWLRTVHSRGCVCVCVCAWAWACVGLHCARVAWGLRWPVIPESSSGDREPSRLVLGTPPAQPIPPTFHHRPEPCAPPRPPPGGGRRPSSPEERPFSAGGEDRGASEGTPHTTPDTASTN